VTRTPALSAEDDLDRETEHAFDQT